MINPFIRIRCLILAILPMILLLSSCTSNSPPPTEPAKDLSERKFELVIFSAKWCTVCAGVPNLVNDLNSKFLNMTVKILDVDVPGHKQRWLGYRCDAVPYLFVLVDGKVVGRLRGLPNTDRATRWITEALSSTNATR